MKKIITTLLIIGFAVTSFSQSITNINDANSFLPLCFLGNMEFYSIEHFVIPFSKVTKVQNLFYDQ